MAGNYVSGAMIHSSKVEPVNDRFHPKASPMFADRDLMSEDLPPLLIQVGEREYLFDESMVFLHCFTRVKPGRVCDYQLVTMTSSKSKVPVATTPIRCEIYEDMTHVFQLLRPLGVGIADVACQRGEEFLMSIFGYPK
jgi:acetyl esterase/lipase